ncbi:piggyBac transposable element-derived protein 4-like [Erpetoichthys calabaricus]|uniref:piggyBac transposable element-derived protein 4-like n=1 Tax=Erpetoichthys calabaricus TaxID=27687 RepID=UPI00223402B6|nr:piggyBac transposable element-derived protein 4-like [Erpetoichthys calabaricus]
MWNDIDEEYLDAYIGVLLLAGVYKSSNEATDSLWDASTGRNIFRATMSLQSFRMISRVLRFDNRETREKSDKLAPIRDVWERWVQLLPLMFNPGPEVTVDERFVPFRGKCPFRQYMPSKPGKYGIKILAACDAKTSYAWNLQIYTGKHASGIPEKNQGKRVVLDMTTGLQGHNITCDNFFTSYDLGQELLRWKLTMVGTVKKNKPDLLVEDSAGISEYKNLGVHITRKLDCSDNTMAPYKKGQGRLCFLRRLRSLDVCSQVRSG